MNLDELKKKHAEMGKEIERLEKGPGLTWGDIKNTRGVHFRETDGVARRVTIGNSMQVAVYQSGEISLLESEVCFSHTPVVLIGEDGVALPPEKQVRP